MRTYNIYINCEEMMTKEIYYYYILTKCVVFNICPPFPHRNVPPSVCRTYLITNKTAEPLCNSIALSSVLF